VLVVHSDELTARLVALAVASAVLKGFIFPILLFRSLREAGVQREVEPFVGFTLSLALGVVATGVAFSLADALPTLPHTGSDLIVPVALANVFFGLMLLVARRKAVTQVLGYLVMENGIFIFSLALVASLPTLVEMGILLDLFVGVFVMGITIYQINREFDHIDASRIRQLQDLGGGCCRAPLPHKNHRGTGGDGK
jgi:hydrogenase-4 component E